MNTAGDYPDFLRNPLRPTATMKERPLRTSVIGSLPLPGWLEFAAQSLDKFGSSDILEIQTDATTVAVRDQLAAGLDVITDGEQTRLDFNLSFYGYLAGINLEATPPRRWGPPAHDQRGKHEIVGQLGAPRGLGVVEEYERLKAICAGWVPDSVTLKASIPGPFTLSGRLSPNRQYSDRFEITEALLPLVRRELEGLIAAGCKEVCVDEPSMSCYAHKEDTKRLVDIFNRTIEPIVGKTRVCMHLCFGNYKGHSVGSRRPQCMFPDFLEMKVDEMHIEMAALNYVDVHLIREVVGAGIDAAIGVIDVKGYYIESPEDIAERIRNCLQFAPPERLVFAPDCGLSQTARWAARQKLANMVSGAQIVRRELGLEC